MDGTAEFETALAKAVEARMDEIWVRHPEWQEATMPCAAKARGVDSCYQCPFGWSCQLRFVFIAGSIIQYAGSN